MSDILNILKGIKPLFGCFASEQEAYDDAQIEEDRIIY